MLLGHLTEAQSLQSMGQGATPNSASDRTSPACWGMLGLLREGPTRPCPTSATISADLRL